MEERESSHKESQLIPTWESYPLDPHNPNDPSAPHCRIIAIYKKKLIVYGYD
jgi:hypothetical protein